MAKFLKKKKKSCYLNRGIDTVKITALYNHKSGIFNNYIRMYNVYLRKYMVVVVVVVVVVRVFIATFNNISVISWWSVLLVGETGVPRENHRPAASHWQTFSHNVGSSNLAMSGIRTGNFRLWEIYIDVYCHSIDKMT